MVQYSASLDLTFSALSDPSRRAIIDRLGQGSATVSELATPAGISLTGMKKHLLVLEEAGLVRTEKRGRSRHCEIDPEGLDEAGFWIERYRREWNDRFNRLDQIIKRKKGRNP
jgi:DNA-binding transcriptional ArsR family regulator